MRDVTYAIVLLAIVQWKPREEGWLFNGVFLWMACSICAGAANG